MAYTEQEFEQKLRDDAASRGVAYDPSDLEDARHRDFSDDALRISDKKYDARSDNTPSQPQNDNNNGQSNPWESSPRDSALKQVSQAYTAPAAPSSVPSAQAFEQQLRAYAASRGVAYDPSDLADAAHRDFSDDALRIAQKKYDFRAGNAPNVGDNNNGNPNPWEQAAQIVPSSALSPYSSSSPSSSSSSGAQTPAAAAAAASPWTQGLRDILMSQLTDLQKPVTENDPGIRDVLAGERIASQRGAERLQSASAERLAASGLHDSGAADTSRLGILQNQGESDKQFTGQVLGHELDSRRSQLNSMLQMALANGDTESARKLQAAIADMNNAYQYSALAQNQNQFNDSMGYQYNALGTNSNLQALLGLLGAA